MRVWMHAIAFTFVTVWLPHLTFGGQALVALHRKNAQLDAVASRSSKNVAVIVRFKLDPAL
jgi:hypothetical protein